MISTAPPIPNPVHTVLEVSKNKKTSEKDKGDHGPDHTGQAVSEY